MEVPVASYAIAAYTAACLMGETAADVFDDDKHSRARYVAIIAMKRVYPDVSYETLAHNFRLLRTPRNVRIAIQNAKTHAWYDPEIEARVYSAIIKSENGPPTEKKPTQATAKEIVGTVFTPRKRAPIIVPRPPANVTGFLMGDPAPRGTQSARQMGGERSHGR